MTLPGSLDTVALLSDRLRGTNIDNDHPPVRIVSLRSAPAPKLDPDSWPIDLLVEFEIGGRRYRWRSRFDADGLQGATADTVALSLATNICALLREMLTTGRTKTWTAVD